MIEVNKIYEGDALSILKTFPEKIFNTCVTSPPYYGLRAYGTNPVIWDGDENCQHDWMDNSYVRNNDKTAGEKQKTNIGAIGRDVPIKNDFCSKCGAWRGELGSEPSPELFVKHIVDIFREVKRTLRDDGTIWVNMGDSYASSPAGNKKPCGFSQTRPSRISGNGDQETVRVTKGYGECKPKDLIGVPWMVAFALRADGWYLRQDIIWSKPNPMPESVTDRCTKAHEYIFLFSKSQRYYFDQDSIKQPVADASIIRLAQQIEKQRGSDRVPNKTNGNMKAVGHGRKPRPDDKRGGNQGTERGIPAMAIDGNGVNGHSGYFDSCGNLIGEGMANKKSVWTVTTKPFKEAHFATFPETLIVDMIKAGSPEDGLVLDPFGGANTTGLVARKLNRNYIAIELNPNYIKIGDNRVYDQIGLFQ